MYKKVKYIVIKKFVSYCLIVNGFVSISNKIIICSIHDVNEVNNKIVLFERWSW